MKIAFDVDNTLINKDDTPKYEVIRILEFFTFDTEADVIIWSGGGVDYAKRWAEKLGFTNRPNVRIIAKGSEKVDIAFDDMYDGEHNIDSKMAKVIIKV